MLDLDPYPDPQHRQNHFFVSKCFVCETFGFNSGPCLDGGPVQGEVDLADEGGEAADGGVGEGEHHLRVGGHDGEEGGLAQQRHHRGAPGATRVEVCLSLKGQCHEMNKNFSLKGQCHEMNNFFFKTLKIKSVHFLYRRRQWFLKKFVEVCLS